MNPEYIVISELQFDNSLINEIKSLSFTTLELATRYDRNNYIKSLRHYHKLSWWQIIKWANYYGWFFSKAGVIDSYRLPIEIENKILLELAKFFGDKVIQDCVVRLQVVYDGEIIPLHIDITRTSSIIYPVSHTGLAYTVFYQRNKAISSKEQLFNPTECQEVNRICINDVPVLLDTTKIHSVQYKDTKLTKNNPRISLSIKWKTLKIDQIINDLQRK